MTYRSEANRIGNKQHYKDLNLSHYPTAIDTRINNTNMRGFVNVGETEAIPDYVMAEYVNAISDATMAVERALGVNPMVYYGATTVEIPELIENTTVSDRITRIENGLFDVRYGGEGWVFVPDRPTLNNHYHTGKNGQPPQVRLESEVRGLLPYKNIDLNYQTGLTGAHISVSTNNPTKISEALNDKLSKTEGGLVSGNVTFTGVVKTRTSMDATAPDIVNQGNSRLVSDIDATASRSLSAGLGDSQSRLFTINPDEKAHLLYGRYVLGVRVKKEFSYDDNIAILSCKLGGLVEEFMEGDIGSEYKTLHFVFEQNPETKNQAIEVSKLPSTETQNILLDSYYITPIHPATLDR